MRNFCGEFTVGKCANFAPKCKSEAQRVEFFKKFSTQVYKLGGNRAKDLKAPKTACQARFERFCESNVNGYSQKTSNGVENSVTDVEKCGALNNAECGMVGADRQPSKGLCKCGMNLLRG